LTETRKCATIFIRINQNDYPILKGSHNMHINKIGFNHFHEQDFFISRPEGSGDYLLLLIKTPALFIINGKEVTAAPSTVMLYKKGSPQFYGACDAEFGNDWLHFSTDTPEDEQLISDLAIPFDTPLALTSLAELPSLLKLLCIEFFSSNLHRDTSLELLLRLFFMKVSEKLSFRAEGDFGSWHERMSGTRAMIYNNPAREWTVDVLAKRLNMSRSSFQHTYKVVFGISPMKDVITARTEHAKYLLSSTDHTVAQIAQLCGYSSDVHFMRQFRQQTGMTPSAYRHSVKI